MPVPVLTMNDEDTLLDLVRDEYISVLLEFYATKSEMDRPSPSEFYKVNFWKIRVNEYERGMFPENIRGRVIYRVRKAEKQGFNPIQMAMIRYAWYAFLSESETAEEVRKRWQTYFIDRADSRGHRILVGHDEFNRRRSFFDLIVMVKKSELWPWEE